MSFCWTERAGARFNAGPGRRCARTPDPDGAFTCFLGQLGVGAFFARVLGCNALEVRAQVVAIDAVAGKAILCLVQLVIGQGSAAAEPQRQT